MRAQTIALLTLLAASSASAQQADTLRVDLATALRMGLESRPDLREAAAAVGVASGERRQAGTYPFNPIAQLKLGSISELGDYEATLSQELEWAGQMGLRKAVADRALDAAEARVDAARVTATYEIRLAHHSASAAELRYQLRLRDVELRSRLRDAVATQLREGQVSTLELNLVQVQAGLARAAELGAAADRAAARVELARAMALPPDRPVQTTATPTAAGNLPGVSEQVLVTRALELRPDVRAARASLEGARSHALLVKRLALPNLTIAAVAEGATGNEPRLGVRVGLPVPLLNRSQGTYQAAQADVERHAALLETQVLTVTSEVRRSWETWRAANDALAALAAEAMDATRSNQDLIEIAYREGRLDLPTTLLLEAQLLDAELSFVDAQLAERRAFAELARAVGDVSFDPGG